MESELPQITPEVAYLQAQIAILKAQVEMARIAAAGEAIAPLSSERDLSPLGRTPH